MTHHDMIKPHHHINSIITHHTSTHHQALEAKCPQVARRRKKFGPFCSKSSRISTKSFTRYGCIHSHMENHRDQVKPHPRHRRHLNGEGCMRSAHLPSPPAQHLLPNEHTLPSERLGRHSARPRLSPQSRGLWIIVGMMSDDSVRSADCAVAAQSMSLESGAAGREERRSSSRAQRAKLIAKVWCLLLCVEGCWGWWGEGRKSKLLRSRN